MTENEAIKEMKYYSEEEYGKGLVAESHKMAIQALEEIQQYRAIGTVEKCKVYKELANKPFKQGCLDMQTIDLLNQYKALGTIEEFKVLKEKSVAKKPRFYAHNYYCTECGNLVGNNEFEWQRFLYCDKCGQKLDWQ